MRKIGSQKEIKEGIKDYFRKYAESKPPNCWEDFSAWSDDLCDMVDWIYLKKKKAENPRKEAE